jgi:DNA invertase Pin-like site-specific DNA recombinase
MRQAVIYLRVSSEKQATEERTSLALQEAECRKYAEREGWGVAGVCYDTMTGFDTIDVRPGFQEIRALLHAGQADVLLTWMVDRLFRDQTDLLIAARECQEAGGQIVSVTEGPFDNTPTGRLILGILGWKAEQERITIRDRLHGNMRARVAQGRIKPGPVPAYGYSWIGENKEGYTINEDVAPVVRLIYQAIDDGMSLLAVARMLNTEGIPTPSAYLAAQGRLPGRRRASPAWKRQTITYLVSNPAYAGRYVAYRRTTVKSGKGKRMPVLLDTSDERRIEQPGLVPALVSPEQWERVQAAVRDRALGPVTRADQATAPLLLKGIGVCGVCGGRVTATKYKDDPSGRGYVCMHRKNRAAPGAEACPGGSWLVPTTAVDADVWAQVAEMARDTETFQAMLQAPRRDAQAKLAEANRREGAIRAELEQARKDKEVISSRMVRETDDTLHAIYRQQLQDTIRLISGLETRLGQSQQSEDKLAAYIDAIASAISFADPASAEVRRFAEEMRDRLEEKLADGTIARIAYETGVLEPTREQKRALLRAMGAQVKMYPVKSDYNRENGKRWELVLNVPNDDNGSMLV